MSTAPKKIGRPATGAGLQLSVRLQPDALAALDNWRRHQDDVPTRPEAVRRLLAERLAFKRDTQPRIPMEWIEAAQGRWDYGGPRGGGMGDTEFDETRRNQ